ncbi:hypothetical protein LUZ60_013297 [Juncus effusus]|nr:hypothetical protein LUZ60_013297 [Juncus effusus]
MPIVALEKQTTIEIELLRYKLNLIRKRRSSALPRRLLETFSDALAGDSSVAGKSFKGLKGTENPRSCKGLKGNDRAIGKRERRGEEMTGVGLRWVVQMHRDVPRAARFYSDGLDFTVNVCTLRWAELQSGPLKLALMHSPKLEKHNCYSSMLSFTVMDLTSTMTKLMSLGAELDGPIKYEIHGKVAAMRCIDGHMLGLYEPA